MTEVEKSRKRTRKNWKRDTRAKYRYLMYLAKLEIKNATTNHCYIERQRSKNDYFALWLVAKKLEAKGFKCELRKGEWTLSELFYYDKLTIDWE
jgi:hypothetical protein